MAEDEQLTLPQNHSVNPQLTSMVSEIPAEDVTNPSLQWCKLLGVKVTEKTGWQKNSPEESIAALSDD